MFFSEDSKIAASRVNIIPGWFHETFPAVTIPKIAVLHIDVDWYESVKLCLEKFYDNVQLGGYVVFDDYNDWQGCKLAADEFIQERNLKVELINMKQGGVTFRSYDLQNLP